MAKAITELEHGHPVTVAIYITEEIISMLSYKRMKLILICSTFLTSLFKGQMPCKFIILNVFWYLFQFQAQFCVIQKKTLEEIIHIRIE